MERLYNDIDLRIPVPNTMGETPTSASVTASFQGLELSKPTQNTLVQPDVESSTVQPDNPALEEFTVFPNLPLELRRIIWRHSLPGPRVIEIFSRHENDELRVFHGTHTALFAVMQACKESEEIVLSKYNKIKAEAWNLTGLPRASTSILLFDDKEDIVHLSGSTAPPKFLSFASEDALEKMTSIGLDRHYFMVEIVNCRRSTRSGLLHAYLLQMQNLRKIVVFGDRTISANNRGSFRRLDLRNEVSSDWVLETKCEMKQLVGRDHLLRYLGDIEIEAGSYAEQL